MTALLATLGASRLTFGIVLLLGMAMCTMGIGKTAAQNLWVHPISLAGYVLGAAALLLGIQGLFKLNIVPVDGSLALIAMLVIIVIKFGLAALYPAAH